MGKCRFESNVSPVKEGGVWKVADMGKSSTQRFVGGCIEVRVESDAVLPLQGIRSAEPTDTRKHTGQAERNGHDKMLLLDWGRV